jgi:cytochrome P450
LVKESGAMAQNLATSVGVVPVVRVPGSARKAAAEFNRNRFLWNDRAAALGPLSQLQLGPVRVWVITDPTIARDMLVGDSANWVRPATNRTPIRMGFGENLFTQSEKAWAAMEPTINQSFRKRALEPRLAEMPEIIERELAEVAVGEPVDVVALTGRLALVLAAKVLFGFDLSSHRVAELAKHQHDLVTWVGNRVGSLLNTVPFSFSSSARKMKGDRRVLETFARDVIAHGRARRACAAPTFDLLDALLDSKPNGKALTETELVGHVLGMMLAGNETTAVTLAWAVVAGAENPAEWERVRNDPSQAERFLQESMRMRPTVWAFSRQGKLKAQVGGHRNRWNTLTAVVYLRGMNQREDLWGDPGNFRPDRFDDADSAQKRSLMHFALGPRMCIGMHLAMAEMTAVLPALAQLGNVELDVSAGTPVEDPHFALRAKPGITARFIGVRHPSLATNDSTASATSSPAPKTAI